MSRLARFLKWSVVMLFLIALLGIAASLSAIAAYLSAAPSDIYKEKGDIAVVELAGELFDATSFTKNLRVISRNDTVKGVLVHIDSPGGSVAASQEIYAELGKLAEQKRVYISMAEVAASGAYYIACAGDQIYANPGTITGSIGVLMANADLSGLLDLVRVKPRTLKSGELKDAGSPLRPMTEKERVYLQAILDRLHAQFIAAVATDRHLDKHTVRTLADGRIFSGEEAQTLGLIDQIGTFYDALDDLKKSLGLGEDARILSPEEEEALPWPKWVKGQVLQKTGVLLKLIDFKGLSGVDSHSTRGKFLY